MQTRIITKPEILAPAGAFESVVAAVRCRANAVYLGAKNFSARASAQNFGDDELKSTVSYCHERDVKVHLALNTSLFDSEFSQAQKLIEYAAKIGVDALIVSDLGVLETVKNICPSMSVHASTQLSVASKSGALFAKNVGFDRVVLARELSKKEIGEIAADKSYQTEVFVHGALCMCVSGQCYMSSVFGKRSGNRGRCAQPCRLEFSASGSDNRHLSLKDMSLCSHLSALKNMGVDSFKIEGRMKRPEYVAAATALVYASLEGNDTYEIKELSSEIFSRSGFTDGYFRSQIDKSMFGYRTKTDVENSQTSAKKIKELYRKETPLVKVDARFSADLENGASLVLSDTKGNSFAECSQVVEGNCAADEQIIKRQLSKLGDTPFYLGDFSCSVRDNVFLSASLVNSLRRNAADGLLKMRSMPEERPIFEYEFEPPEKKAVNKQKIYARFEKIGQVPDEAFSLCDKIILPALQIIENCETLEGKEKIICAELDRFMFSNDEKIRSLLCKLENIKIKSVCVSNVGQLEILKDFDFEIMTGAFMNVYNSRAVSVLEKCKVKDITASFELSYKKIGALKSNNNLGALVYGYIPLMMTRACPIKNIRDCKQCKQSGGVLTDRLGKKFKVVCRGTVSEIYNNVPLVAEIENSLFDLLDYLLVFFTFEQKQECKNVLNGVKNKKIEVKGEYTRGLYKTAVL